jgi:hypothetical protein
MQKTKTVSDKPQQRIAYLMYKFKYGSHKEGFEQKVGYNYLVANNETELSAYIKYWAYKTGIQEVATITKEEFEKAVGINNESDTQVHSTKVQRQEHKQKGKR